MRGLLGIVVPALTIVFDNSRFVLQARETYQTQRVEKYWRMPFIAGPSGTSRFTMMPPNVTDQTPLLIQRSPFKHPAGPWYLMHSILIIPICHHVQSSSMSWWRARTNFWNSALSESQSPAACPLRGEALEISQICWSMYNRQRLTCLARLIDSEGSAGRSAHCRQHSTCL